MYLPYLWYNFYTFDMKVLHVLMIISALKRFLNIGVKNGLIFVVVNVMTRVYSTQYDVLKV